MLEYAGNIAAKMGTPLPEAVAVSFEACKDFIDANKEAAMRPSEKQLKFANIIAERKGLSIPPETLSNGKELSAWIDTNK
jgi:DNA topoisomerase-3